MRHESFERTPSLETALLYAALFPYRSAGGLRGPLRDGRGPPARKRAKQLLRSSKGQLPTKALEQKVAFLEGLSGTLVPHYVPCEEW